jgi:hypothetical protein
MEILSHDWFPFWEFPIICHDTCKTNLFKFLVKMFDELTPTHCHLHIARSLIIDYILFEKILIGFKSTLQYS